MFILKGIGHAFPGDPEKEVEKALKFIEGEKRDILKSIKILT